MDSDIFEGIRLYRENRYEDALTVFLKISTKDSDTNFDLVYYIGLCYARLSQYDDSLVYLEQIITAGASIARIYQCRLILAFIYTKTGRLKLAEFELSKLLDAGYKSPQVYAALAYLAYEQDNTKNAISFYEKALEFAPDNPTALNGLGYILAASGQDLTRALVLCKKAFDSQQENTAYMDSLAWVYYKLGFPGPAKQYIQQALEKAPDNELIGYHAKIINDEGEN